MLFSEKKLDLENHREERRIDQWKKDLIDLLDQG